MEPSEGQGLSSFFGISQDQFKVFVVLGDP
jgi:hypothetical protein